MSNLAISRTRTPHMQGSKRATDLRARQTDMERWLWSRLRDRRLNGYKFRRQVPIGAYIADFVCMPARLIVELDGSQHADQEAYDQQRERYLREQGYEVLRFWNNAVWENMEGLLTAILLAVERRVLCRGKARPSPQPSPWRERGPDRGGQ